MFTGIVEEVGKVKAVARGRTSSVLTIAGDMIFEDMKPGDSIAVNGVCLTVRSFSGKEFTADVMHETLDRSSLGQLKPASAVNLERAMSAGGRFGGHIVSGHIDGTGVITDVSRDDNAIWYRVSADTDIMRYIVKKGSVAIDGISLTVAKVAERSFSVSVIPHTAAQTVLGSKKTGDTVNLENDIVGKYIEKLMMPKEEERNAGREITMDFLREAGF